MLSRKTQERLLAKAQIAAVDGNVSWRFARFIEAAALSRTAQAGDPEFIRAQFRLEPDALEWIREEAKKCAAAAKEGR